MKKRRMGISMRFKMKWKKVYEDYNSTESKEMLKDIKKTVSYIYV